MQHPYGYEPITPTMSMTTEQIERLAKAGVTVELAHKVYVQDPPPVPNQRTYDHLTDLITGRWRMSNGAQQYEGLVVPQLKAMQHGDKVYVFAYSGNAEPEIIVDDAAIYPSDALLARIHLMMQHAK